MKIINPLLTVTVSIDGKSLSRNYAIVDTEISEAARNSVPDMVEALLEDKEEF